MSTAAIRYQITPAQPHAHLYQVRLHIAQPLAQQEVSLPVWIPGSYLVREFAKNLQQLRAEQAGAPLTVQQLSKNRWRLLCHGGAPLELHYQVAAYDDSVRTAWLDSQRGFFNATSLCLRVHGQTEQPCTLELRPPAAPLAGLWHCATALPPLASDAQGFGQYLASDYDHLADCPVEMGPFESTEFEAGNCPHRLIIAGAASSFDSKRLAADSQRICAAAIALWHPDGSPPPFADYLFLLNAVSNGYGGLEHRNSTALIGKRSDLPRLGQNDAQLRASEGYTTLLGLISHEYFHAWCVKRLRPAEFAQYDYDQENYTELLWFFEGFTSYYDDLLLRRAGLLDNDAYLKLLGKTINQVLQTPGRQVQSLAQASWDAWVKYYRQDANTANATISYYSKGALVALCLDLSLRREGQSLDAVLRALWQRCAAGPMREADLLAVLQQLSGRSWQTEIDAWVHGTQDLPLAELLAEHGVQLSDENAQPAQQLGLRVQENHSIHIKTVLRHSPAEAAGMMAGDEWLGLEVGAQAWRIQQLADLELYAGQQRQVTALLARDGRLLRLPLHLPDSSNASNDTVRLQVQDAALVQRWLDGA